MSSGSVQNLILLSASLCPLTASGASAAVLPPQSTTDVLGQTASSLDFVDVQATDASVDSFPPSRNPSSDLSLGSSDANSDGLILMGDADEYDEIGSEDLEGMKIDDDYVEAERELKAEHDRIISEKHRFASLDIDAKKQAKAARESWYYSVFGGAPEFTEDDQKVIDEYDQWATRVQPWYDIEYEPTAEELQDKLDTEAWEVIVEDESDPTKTKEAAEAAHAKHQNVITIKPPKGVDAEEISEEVQDHIRQLKKLAKKTGVALDDNAADVTMAMKQIADATAPLHRGPRGRRRSYAEALRGGVVHQARRVRPRRRGRSRNRYLHHHPYHAVPTGRHPAESKQAEEPESVDWAIQSDPDPSIEALDMGSASQPPQSDDELQKASPVRSRPMPVEETIAPDVEESKTQSMQVEVTDVQLEPTLPVARIVPVPRVTVPQPIATEVMKRGDERRPAPGPERRVLNRDALNVVKQAAKRSQANKLKKQRAAQLEAVFSEFMSARADMETRRAAPKVADPAPSQVDDVITQQPQLVDVITQQPQRTEQPTYPVATIEPISLVPSAAVAIQPAALKIAEPVVIYRPRQPFPEVGTTGIPNTGNSCWFNVITQSIFRAMGDRLLRELENYEVAINARNAQGHHFLKALLDLLRDYRDNSDGVASREKPIAFQQAIREMKPYFYEKWTAWSDQPVSTWGQQKDAPEGFDIIMDCLVSELDAISIMDEARDVKSEYPASIFKGTFQNVMMCNHHQCKHKSVKFDAFQKIDLEIPDARAHVDQTVVLTKTWQHSFLPFETEEVTAADGRRYLVVTNVNDASIPDLRKGAIIQSVNMFPVYSKADLGRMWYPLQNGDKMFIQTLIPRNFVSLSECVQSFSKAELVSDYKCDKCKALGSHKQLRPCSLPDVLVVSLKRFEMVMNAAGTDVVAKKRTDPVTFPIDGLEMKNHCVHILFFLNHSATNIFIFGWTFLFSDEQIFTSVNFFESFVLSNKIAEDEHAPHGHIRPRVRYRAFRN